MRFKVGHQSSVYFVLLGMTYLILQAFTAKVNAVG
jgi:hypothetical protein